jgi:hypothetical protein
MTRHTIAALLLVSAFTAGACAPGPYYGRRHGNVHRQPYRGGERRLTDDDAWEIVRHDPCRYEEYRRYAARHKNPTKRRDAVWRLARDGCSLDRHDYDHGRDRR